MARIDIIVPVFRVESYINRCLDSILCQSFQDFCLIIVDDGSDDNCPQICDQYEENDSRIHVIHQSNQGLSAARNAGIEWALANSDSDWIAFIDSDDWVHQDYCEFLLNAAETNELNIAVTNLKKVSAYENNTSIQDPIIETMSVKDYYMGYYENSIPACGKLYKKGLFKNVRFPVGRLHEDEFTTYKVLFSQNEIVYVQNNLYYYFFNAAGITQSLWTPKRLDSLKACEERLEFFLQRNETELYGKTAVIYLSYIHLMIGKINRIKDPSTVKKYINMLRTETRKMLHANPLIRVSRFPGLFEFAYPMEMRLYWYWKAIIKKLKTK